MRDGWRPLLRAVVIGAGGAVALAGVFAFRVVDLPVYIVFAAVSVVLFLPYVEVLPRLPLSIPDLAATIGFLYIGGLPIIVLRTFTPLFARSLRRVVPRRWQDRIPQLRADAGVARGELFVSDRFSGTSLDVGVVADWAAFALGLGTRWWAACALTDDRPPANDLLAVAAAEVLGHGCWSMLTLMPVFSYRPFLLPRIQGTLRAAVSDISLVVVLALTPLVFLIAYGFRVHGLPGAALWSVSALGLHFMLRRLTERRLTVEEQNRRLETLNRELEHRERLSAIGKMSSVVSHQLLQQLGVIGIYTDLIRKSGSGTPAHDPAALLADARDKAAAIEGALGNVNRVLRDLLVFSKDLKLNTYRHDLAGVLRECVDECRRDADERRVKLRCESVAGVDVVLDKLKFKQALVNVVRNAIQAAPAHSEVVVHGGARDDTVEIRVSDRGPGIPEGDRAAVFTPFFTTKEHGTGLGLAIAREFIEAHGGTLDFEENPQHRGTTFVFRLPRAQAGRQ